MFELPHVGSKAMQHHHHHMHPEYHGRHEEHNRMELDLGDERDGEYEY